MLSPLSIAEESKDLEEMDDHAYSQNIIAAFEEHDLLIETMQKEHQKQTDELEQ